MIAKINGIKLIGSCVVLGEKCVEIESELEAIFKGDINRLERVKRACGLKTRFLSDDNCFFSDLAKSAANNLFLGICKKILNQDSIKNESFAQNYEDKIKTLKESIKLCICVGQGMDFLTPASACFLAGELGLKNDCAAFDINQACAGFTYGLYSAASALSFSEKGTKALLFCGDVFSKLCSKNDPSLRPLIGDGVAAILLEKCEDSIESNNEIIFELGSNGSKFYELIAPGIRNDREALAKKFPQATIFQSDRYFDGAFMNGGAIFDFALQTAPTSLNAALQAAQTKQQELDFIFLHQANDFLIENIRRKLELPKEKVPNGICGKFGNLSAASIPACICETLTQTTNKNPLKVAFCGFGAGLSWGSAILQISNDFYCEKIKIYNSS